jgi:hypothetical protein
MRPFRFDLVDCVQAIYDLNIMLQRLIITRVVMVPMYPAALATEARKLAFEIALELNPAYGIIPL